VRPWALLAVGVVAILAGLTVHQTGALDGLERASIDQRFAVRGHRPPRAGIVLVEVDQRSLAEIGQRPPIQRRMYAELLDRLAAARPRLIAVDVQFIGATTAADDSALIEAVQRHGPVVLATHDGPNGPIPVPVGRTHVRGAVPASAGIDVDPDSVLRRMIYAPVKTRTLPVEAAELLTGRPPSESEFPGNHAWIDFAGPPGSYPHYSFVDVLQGRVGVEDFRGKTVLVGITDPTERDVFVTSVSSTPMSGVEIEANALATILAGLPLREESQTVLVLTVLLAAAIPCLAAARLAALPVLGLGLGALVAYLVVAQLAFDCGRIVALFPPVVTLILATAGAATVDSISEKRRRAALEATLSSLPVELHPVFFLSYRRDQSSWPARALKQGLEERFGDATVFMDLESIYAGQDWEARIREAVRSCSVLLVLIGNYWLEARNDKGDRRIDDPGDWVRREIEEALAASEVTVIPVLLDGASMPTTEQLPPSLAEMAARNAFPLPADTWEPRLDQLVESLRAGRLNDALRKPRAGGEPSNTQTRSGVAVQRDRK
jgi:CHASE2 domain-containing sensor protein